MAIAGWGEGKDGEELKNEVSFVAWGSYGTGGEKVAQRQRFNQRQATPKLNPEGLSGGAGFCRSVSDVACLS